LDVPPGCPPARFFAPTGHCVARWEGTGAWCSVGNMIISKVPRSRAGRHVCRPYSGMEGDPICRSYVQYEGSRGGTEAAPYKTRLSHLESTCSICQVLARPGGRAPHIEIAKLKRDPILPPVSPFRRGELRSPTLSQAGNTSPEAHRASTARPYAI